LSLDRDQTDDISTTTGMKRGVDNVGQAKGRKTRNKRRLWSKVAEAPSDPSNCRRQKKK